MTTLTFNVEAKYAVELARSICAIPGASCHVPTKDELEQFSGQRMTLDVRVGSIAQHAIIEQVVNVAVDWDADAV